MLGTFRIPNDAASGPLGKEKLARTRKLQVDTSLKIKLAGSQSLGLAMGRITRQDKPFHSLKQRLDK